MKSLLRSAAPVVCLTTLLLACDQTAGILPTEGAPLVAQVAPLVIAPVNPDTGSMVAPIAPGRPASVPANFRLTPHGYFHPDCVVQVADGETVGENGLITRVDGSVRTVSRCGVPHYDPFGRAIEPDEGVPLGPTAGELAPETRLEKTEPYITNIWTAYVYNESKVPISYLHSDWVVPANPPISGDQVLFLWAGLEPLATSDTVVQPVLGWEGSWSISSWNCCMYGNAYESTPVAVAVGDVIHGGAFGTKCDGGACGVWTIITNDITSGKGTTLVSTVDGEVLNYVLPAVEEVYYITHCAQYSASGQVLFNTVTENMAGQTLALPWTALVPPADPACSQAGSIGDGGYVSVSTEATTQAKPVAPTTCTRISEGQGLYASESYASCDGKHHLAFELDGGLEITHDQSDGGVLTTWSTGTFGNYSSYEATLESGGAFIQRDMVGKQLYTTGTVSKGDYMVLENSGDLILFSSANVQVWHSNTANK